jgi:hypothetical protein
VHRLRILTFISIVLFSACSRHETVAPTTPISSAPSPMATITPPPATMPSVTGDTLEEARAAILGISDAQIHVSTTTTDQYLAGTVFIQVPNPETILGQGSDVYLTVAKAPPPPTASDVAATVAGQIASYLSHRVTYAVGSSSDGYVLECDQSPCQGDAYRVRFGRAIILANGVNSAKGKTGYMAIASAVGDNLDLLNATHFRFVVLSIGKVVIGFKLDDWPNFGTPQQPSDPLLGLITNPRLKYLKAG